MSQLGRLHCFLISTKGVGNVVYERFYDRLSEYEKADVRAAFQLASSNVRFDGEQEDFIGVYKTACFVFIPMNDMVFYLMGSGEYDELACSGILRSIGFLLQDVLKTKCTSSALLEKYGKMCCVIDVCSMQGILETTDRDIVRKALKNKAVWE
ncbi:Zeta2-COP [Dunaliella salina]|uniref:Coatomer subunit zeta n=1 Tax=Dunaliella salina TaxID=3046 RepID=A0ABQ7G2W2_DUNSA|nr:Zeta2-COP [Dunaliella salina]|eukprot:KAF5828941.1 Zeta2-COP [Dunaliella salina]